MASASLIRQMAARLDSLEQAFSSAQSSKPAPPAPWTAQRLMAAVQMTPDPWQAELLGSPSRRILLCAARQSGKSQAVGARVLADALCHSNSFCLIVSPTLRQSGELFREKVLTMYRAAGSPLYQSAPTQLELRLSNGSRIISLPESESGIRCFAGVTTLV